MSKSDNSLYVRNKSDNPIVIILYVDDLVIGGKNVADISKVKSLLSNRFEMKYMREVHYFLGIEVIRIPIGIMIFQWHYILNLLYKFGMTKCNLCQPPLIETLSSSSSQSSSSMSSGFFAMPPKPLICLLWTGTSYIWFFHKTKLDPSNLRISIWSFPRNG